MLVTTVDLDALVRNWWVVLLRGMAGVLFGIVTFAAPGLSLAVLVLLFGAYAFADGILAIVTAVRHRHGSGVSWGWGTVLSQGFAGIVAGALTLVWPGITALVLLYLIAAWAVVTGALEVAAAIRLRRVLEHEWLLVLSGLLSVALGLFLMSFPLSGALVVVLWIGAYALVSGVLLIVLALRLRSWGRTHTPHPAHSPA